MCREISSFPSRKTAILRPDRHLFKILILQVLTDDLWKFVAAPARRNHPLLSDPKHAAVVAPRRQRLSASGVGLIQARPSSNFDPVRIYPSLNVSFNHTYAIVFAHASSIG